MEKTLYYDPQLEHELMDKIHTSAARRYGDAVPTDISARIAVETEHISGTGWGTALAIAAKLAEFSQSRGYPVGFRGLAGNLYITYLLGITAVDPVASGLRWESCLGTSGNRTPDITLNAAPALLEDIRAYLGGLLPECEVVHGLPDMSPYHCRQGGVFTTILNLFPTHTGGGGSPAGTLIPGHISTLSGNAGKLSTVLSDLFRSPLEVLWIGGMVVLSSVFTVLLIKNYWALKTAKPLADNEYITEWRAKYCLKRPLEIVRSDKVTSPASLGILRPRIIFPMVMDTSGGEKLQYILVHEYFHIRRFDMLWKLQALCAVCVHWLNPFAWVMLFLLNRDLELSRDEMVLRHFGGTERAAYAHSLINMAERSPAFTIMHSYFSKNAAEDTKSAVQAIMENA